MLTVFRSSSVAAIAAVFGLTTILSHAQTAWKPLTCMTLLIWRRTDQRRGRQVREHGRREKGGGDAEGCAGASFKTVNVQFYNLAYITDTTFKTSDAWFEQVVSATEGVSSKKREMLPGIGQKAAFVAADPQVLAVVQRADGVARIVANNLTKAQITAVARAVATP